MAANNGERGSSHVKQSGVLPYSRSSELEFRQRSKILRNPLKNIIVKVGPRQTRFERWFLYTLHFFLPFKIWTRKKIAIFFKGRLARIRKGSGET